MTDEKIRDVLDKYEQLLQHYPASPWALHMLTMIPKMREMIACPVFLPDHNAECLNCDEWADAHEPARKARAQREKLMRWLGFLQGALWVKGIYTIDEMRAHNMPDGETPRA